MKDRALRRTVKRLALWHFTLNVWVYRRWQRFRGQEHYLLGGDCQRCAKCCEAPAIQVGRLTWHVGFVRRIFLAWQRHVNGFELTGQDPDTSSFIFRCSHFDWATRTCDSYDSRPGLCRDYPRLLLEQPNPEFLSGCGYRAVWRKSDAFKDALRSAGIPAVVRERLERELRLESPDRRRNT